MNVQEFAKLKVGDVIRNHMSNGRGEVVEVDKSGVRVRWPTAGIDPSKSPTWHYSVQSTAWFHWTLEREEISPELDKAISDELAHPPASIVKPLG